jgi:hypothetical protein
MSSQNITITLTRQMLEKVRLLAARLVGSEEAAYQRAQRQAMALLDQGFHMGSLIRASRDEWHERSELRPRAPFDKK